MQVTQTVLHESKKEYLIKCLKYIKKKSLQKNMTILI